MKMNGSKVVAPRYEYRRKGCPNGIPLRYIPFYLPNLDKQHLLHCKLMKELRNRYLIKSICKEIFQSYEFRLRFRPYEFRLRRLHVPDRVYDEPVVYEYSQHINSSLSL